MMELQTSFFSTCPWLHAFPIQLYLDSQCIPKQVEGSHSRSYLKAKIATGLDKYRPIAFTNTMCKLTENIINYRFC